MVDILRVDLRKAVLAPGDSLPWGSTPIMKKCPEHTDDSDSLAIFPDHVKCFGCHFKIQKRMEALAWLLQLRDYREAMSVAASYYLTDDELSGLRKASEVVVRPPCEAMVAVYEKILWSQETERLNWFRERGFADQTIKSFRFGHTGASFVIPIFDKDYRLLTFRFRRDDHYGTQWSEYDESTDKYTYIKRSKYKGVRGINGTYLYPAWKIENDYRDWAVIVEGELDADRLWQEDTPTCTITNGAGNLSSILALLPRRIKRLVILGDMDSPGREAVEKLRGLALEEGYEVETPEWPLEQGKDVTEWLNNGHSIKEIIHDYSLQGEQFAWGSFSVERLSDLLLM